MKYILLFLLGFPIASSGAEFYGVEFPDSITVNGSRLVLNGAGMRHKTVFNVKVYAAALYLAAQSSDEGAILKSDTPKCLELVFLRNVQAKDIANSWDEGYEGNCKPGGCDGLKERLERLKAAMTDVTKNQRIRFTFTNKDVTIATSSKETRFEGRDFADFVLANFIGVPPSEELKEGLLGKLGTPSGERSASK